MQNQNAAIPLFGRAVSAQKNTDEISTLGQEIGAESSRNVAD